MPHYWLYEIIGATITFRTYPNDNSTFCYRQQFVGQQSNPFQIRRCARQTKPMQACHPERNCHPERSEGSLSSERSFAALRMAMLLIAAGRPQGIAPTIYD